MTSKTKENESCLLTGGLFVITIVIPAYMCWLIVNLFMAGQHERALFLVGLVALNIILANLTLTRGKWGWYAIGAEVVIAAIYAVAAPGRNSVNIFLWVITLAIIIGTAWRRFGD